MSEWTVYYEEVINGVGYRISEQEYEQKLAAMFKRNRDK